MPLSVAQVAKGYNAMACEPYRELSDLVQCLCDTAQETIKLAALNKQLWDTAQETMKMSVLQKQLYEEMVARSRELLKNSRVPQKRISANGSLSSQRLNRVRDYVESHLGERLTLADLARVACLSPCHFSRSFKQSVGVGPQRYLREQRLERAKVLMRRTNEPLAHIAQETGFADQSHLTSIFHRETGTTPGKYRAVSGEVPPSVADGKFELFEDLPQRFAPRQPQLSVVDHHEPQ
jgi:AraC-like DNA-binding protein